MLDFSPSAAKTAAVQSTAQISSERMNKDVLRIKEILLVGESLRLRLCIIFSLAQYCTHTNPNQNVFLSKNFTVFNFAQMKSFRLPACRQAEALFILIALRAARAATSASAAALFAGADRMDDSADDRRGDEQQDNNVGGTHTGSLPTL